MTNHLCSRHRESPAIRVTQLPQLGVRSFPSRELHLRQLAPMWKRIALKSLLAIILCSRLALAESPPNSFAYVLQAESLDKSKAKAVELLAASGRDWVVLDMNFDDHTKWQRTDIEMIRSQQKGRKVLAYISIGEAEDYRPYWQKEWVSKNKLTTSAPHWLGIENPEWKGNYCVKYWNADWQKIMLAAMDDVMACGFDGVYLDKVDAFETFEQNGHDFIDDRLNPETNQSYRRDMVEWVKTIAGHVRAKNAEALVIPQNGSQLVEHPDFLEDISAIGIEDLFTNGNKVQPKSHTNEVLENLKKMASDNKPILVIEYSKSPELQAITRKRSIEDGLVWLVTDRQLKTLGVSGR